MEIKKYKNNFKHKSNIQAVLDSTYLTSIMPENCNYYLGGGFPTALLFAPRKANSLNMIANDYYSDIDLFFSTKKDFQDAREIFELLRQTPTVRKEIETENAVTYILYVQKKNGALSHFNTIQLVKTYVGTPTEILSTFDIVNARVLYSLKEDTWYFDKRTLAAFASKRLILSTSTPYLDEEDSIFFQLERLSKYAIRYDLELDNQSLYRLINLNKQKPNLSFYKNEKVSLRGYYSVYSKTIQNTFNVWTAFSNLFTDNRHWQKIKPLVKNISKSDNKNAESPF